MVWYEFKHTNENFNLRILHPQGKSSSALGKTCLRFFALVFCQAISLGIYADANPTAADAEWKIIHAGEALLEPGKAPSREVSIIVKGNSIDRVVEGYIGLDSLALDDTSAEIIDLKDSYVLPGLMDAHVHLTSAGRKPSESYDMARIQGSLRTPEEQTIDGVANAYTTLMAGYTTVRDVGASNADAIFALRDAIKDGKVLGPRIYAAGTSLSPTAGHGDSASRAKIARDTQSRGVCDGTESCLQRTRWQIRNGANLIKLHATGGGSEESGGKEAAPSFTPEEFETIVRTAHDLGRKVAAHAHGFRGINAALKAGVDSIEHGDGSNDESMKLFQDTGAYLVPTLSVLNDLQRRLDQMAQFGETPYKNRYETVIRDMPVTIGKLYKGGVKIAAGSDAPLNPHGENADELIWYVKIGMSPANAIKAATLTTAELIGIDKQAGSLETGKWADIIAVDGNPSKEIGDLKKIVFVMKGGIVYSKRK